jgi:hypothetical protein
MRAAITVLLACLISTTAAAQRPTTRTHILNGSKQVEITSFAFRNAAAAGEDITYEAVALWRNAGQAPIAAIEFEILAYDAFGNRTATFPWSVTGLGRGDWNALAPGAESGRGENLLGVKKYAFSALLIVRGVRTAEGTVWEVNQDQLVGEVRKLAPDLRDFRAMEVRIQERLDAERKARTPGQR